MDGARFEPLKTQRLVVRAARPDDADALADRRNQPEVAEFQNWTLPFSLERAREIVDGVGPSPDIDNWWMATVTSADGGILGDLAVRLGQGGKSAEVGYTFASEHWGNGYAVEAVDALVDWLFSVRGVGRVHAMLHPDNVASAQVLERTGMLFEGHTRLSYWVGNENSDDLLYGMTRADREAWTSRQTAPAEAVELVEITPENVYDFRRLRTHRSQERLVAPVMASLADALVPEVIDGAPVAPWFRGVAADGEPAGFVMLAEVTEHHPEPYLWRLLVDRMHQRRGIGERILDEVCTRLRSEGAETLMTSWVDGRGSPRPFYERYGFVATGDIVDGEIEARLHIG